MDIQKARKLLGKKDKNLTDEQVLEFIHTGEVLADVILDMWLKMTPEEKKKWKVNNPQKKLKKGKIMSHS